MADTLGIFGKYGIYAATMWKTAYGPFHSAAYKIYRNYNGANGKYGNTKVYCESNDIANITSYASINGSDESELHIIVINKAGTNQTANVNITSGVTYTSAECWGFGGASYNITSRTAPTLAGNSFSYSVPAYSVLHFVLKSNVTPTITPVVSASNTPTRTVTQTPTIFFTPTLTHPTNELKINEIYIYPNPFLKNSDRAFLYYDIEGQIKSIKLKIYTISFREIQQIEFTQNLTGISEIPDDKIKNLANGIYFFICVLKDKDGNELKSRIAHFIVVK